MKSIRKPVIIFCTVLLAAAGSYTSQAHELRHNRATGHISIAGPAYYAPFPAATLIGGITYRNYQSRQNMHDRVINSRPSANRVYQAGYRDGFRDGRSSANRHNSHGNCYELYHDRNGHQVRRQLPAAACRH